MYLLSRKLLHRQNSMFEMKYLWNLKFPHRSLKKYLFQDLQKILDPLLTVKINLSCFLFFFLNEQQNFIWCYFSCLANLTASEPQDCVLFRTRLLWVLAWWLAPVPSHPMVSSICDMTHVYFWVLNLRLSQLPSSSLLESQSSSMHSDLKRTKTLNPKQVTCSREQINIVSLFSVSDSDRYLIWNYHPSFQMSSQR